MRQQNCGMVNIVKCNVIGIRQALGTLLFGLGRWRERKNFKLNKKKYDDVNVSRKQCRYAELMMPTS